MTDNATKQMTKYAVRIPHEGGWLYRSSSSSRAVAEWDGAQFWNNAAKAEHEAKKLRERSGWYIWWDGVTSRKVPVDGAEVVSISIKEPLIKGTDDEE